MEDKIKRIRELIRIINEAGKAYYQEDREIMSNYEYDALYARHKEMGCVCYENPGMGIYFIADPDGYWIEICPEKD